MVEKVKADNEYEGKVRTDMHCTNCSKKFLAKIDFDVDGNHEIVCPMCGHSHYRVIEKGKITSDRWDSASDTSIKDQTQKLWTDDSRKLQTSSVSQFLRERWLNLEQS